MTCDRRRFDDPPGGLLPWLIVGLELGTFTIVFSVIAVLRAGDRTIFAAGQACLSQGLGVSLTLLLLTSGALAAFSVRAFRRGDRRTARRGLLAAAAVGGLFVTTKVWDYTHLAAAGHWLGSNMFWDAYVLATSFHLLHVLVGITVLLGAASALRRPPKGDAETGIAGPALFWHMCDVVWFFLWPLLYVGGSS